MGTIDGYRVPCLSGRQQLSFRHGYDWRQVDHHDVALLRAVIGRTD
jgi:lincosamide nucleotidyltransferase A/C/D/E